MTIKKGPPRKDWRPKVPLVKYFTPTNEKLSGERTKARNKNINLPLLQYMYHGDELKPLECVISGAPGFVDFDCLIGNNVKQRFNIDFNHVRQRQNGKRQSGVSVDKHKYDPSHLFRYRNLYDNTDDLLEFMCIFPVSQEYHNYISQDSSLGHITLVNYDSKYWPWFLKSKANYNALTSQFKLDFNYEWFIDHLSDINHLPIRKRLLVHSYNPFNPTVTDPTTILDTTFVT